MHMAMVMVKIRDTLKGREQLPVKEECKLFMFLGVGRDENSGNDEEDASGDRGVITAVDDMAAMIWILDDRINK